MNIKNLFKKIWIVYSQNYYNIDKSCIVWKSKKIKNIKCEGYNTISKDSTVINVSIGFASGISMNSYILDACIGRFTALAPGVRIVKGSHPTSQFVSIHPAFYSLKKQYGFTYVKEQRFNEFRTVNGKYAVVIGNDVWIGSNALTMEGVVIGDGAIVAAGAVVTKNVPPYAIVGGIPAKIIRYRFVEDDIEFLLKLQWWNKPLEWIKLYAEYFDDIEKLREVLKNEEEI